MKRPTIMAAAIALTGCSGGNDPGSDAVNGQQNAALSAIADNTQDGAGTEGLDQIQANQAAIGQGVRDSLAAPPRPPGPR